MAEVGLEVCCFGVLLPVQTRPRASLAPRCLRQEMFVQRLLAQALLDEPAPASPEEAFLLAFGEDASTSP